MNNRESYDQANIAAINHLIQIFKELKNLDIKLRNNASGENFGILNEGNQLSLLLNISVDDINSKYLVYRLINLNNHLHSGFPDKDLGIKLTRKALNAVLRCVRASGYKYAEVRLKAIASSMGFGYTSRTNALPYRVGHESNQQKQMENQMERDEGFEEE